MVCNFTPVPRHQYRLGLPYGGAWTERLNTDATVYGGSGMGNFGTVSARAEPYGGRPFCADVSLPPLATLFLVCGQRTESRHDT